MIDLCRLIWCGLFELFRWRASLEIEIMALRHQLNILRRFEITRLSRAWIDGHGRVRLSDGSKLQILEIEPARCMSTRPCVVNNTLPNAMPF
jgi:hypothetical protein